MRRDSDAPRADPRRDRVTDLLCDRAAFGLDLDEALELASLRDGVPPDQYPDPECFDRLVADLTLSFVRPAVLPPLPGHLRRRLEDAALALAARRAAGAHGAAGHGHAGPRGRIGPWVPAAAAILLVAVVLAGTRFGRQGTMPDADGGTDALRAQLERAPDLLRLALAPENGALAGEILWSTSLQRGMMRVAGLPANDANELQYQLWIFDSARLARGEQCNAVDGGVFDAAGSEVLIPIGPAVRVYAPSRFAVTAEPPGGVVRHDPALDPGRFRIIATAAPSG